jgi:hypothetical protein
MSANPNVRPVLFVQHTFAVLFVERMSSGPHMYVCAKNSGVRLLDLAYVPPQRNSVWHLFLRD